MGRNYDYLRVEKIDRTRNLCDTCKFLYPDCDGDPEFGDCVGNDNIIRCKKYAKPNRQCKRVEQGQSYWCMYREGSILVSKERVDMREQEDDVRHEYNNYFLSDDECNIHIQNLKKK